MCPHHIPPFRSEREKAERGSFMPHPYLSICTNFHGKKVPKKGEKMVQLAPKRLLEWLKIVRRSTAQVTGLSTLHALSLSKKS